MKYNENEIDTFREFLNIIWPEYINDMHMEDTPRRVIEMYKEFFHPPKPKITLFEADSNEMVTLHNIPFYSMCSHHMLPIVGQAHVGYIPNGQIIGLSKIPRIVKYTAQRPQVQERLTTDIADYLFDVFDEQYKPSGIGVVLSGIHFCMEMRGVGVPGVKTITSALRGSFKDNPSQRTEFLAFVERYLERQHG